jgi:serine/threonine protein kinase
MNVKNLSKNIELLNIIGKGSYGNVYLGKNVISNQYYAIKVISKSQLQSKIVYQYFNNEIYILKHIDHPNIVKYISLLEQKKDYWLIIEYCNGGSLVKALKYHLTKFNKPVPEKIVRYFIKNILTAVIYLNNKKLIHRDIKSDNILLHYENEEDLLSNNFMKAKIKLIDFGFARYLDENELAGSLVGTPMYMDPNVLKTFLESKSRVVQGFYDQKVDIWSLGILTYELLIGIVPFMSKDIKGLFQNVHKRDFYIPKEEKRDFYLSENAIKFIDKTLNIDPNARPLPSELIEDPWFNDEDGVLYQMKTDEEIKLINNKKLFINFWKPKDNSKIIKNIILKEKINFKNKEFSFNLDKEKKKKLLMNFHRNKHLFRNLNNTISNNHIKNNDEKKDEHSNNDDKNNNIENINNYQHKKNGNLSNISNNYMNNYKYTKKKPKKIMKNMDLILNNFNEEENMRYNT